MATNFQFEFEGIEELQKDMLHASVIAPKELNKGLSRISRKFKANMKKRAEAAYQTAEHITSGMTMTSVKSENYVMYSYFKPEARGNKAHHWHLQEEGYELTRPTFRSRELGIVYSDARRVIKFIPGRHLIDKEIPSFTEFMGREAYRVVDEILAKENL